MHSIYNKCVFILYDTVKFYDFKVQRGPSWSWSYDSLIYNYLCNQCRSPLTLWVWIPFMGRCTRYNIMWYSLSVTYDRLVVFSWYCGFLHQWNWPPRYSWNIIESGVKHHKPNHQGPKIFFNKTMENDVINSSFLIFSIRSIICTCTNRNLERFIP